MTELEYLKRYSKNYDEAIKRFNEGEPVQYIVGDVNFYGNIINVDKRVLIPRFETEELVEKTVEYIKKHYQNPDIVDLGTGSGCIAITLKKMFPNSNIDAVDISLDALDLAQENAKLNGVNINFIHGDMLKPLTKKYDVIISNPPYIAYDEKIMDVVKNNEPHIALYADNNGLYFYEEIIKNAHKYLKNNGLIAFEIGYKQSEKIKEFKDKYLPNTTFELKYDMTGRERFIFIKLKDIES